MTTLHYIPYGYVPTEWLCIMFVVIFSISTLMHLIQARRHRIRWLVPTAVMCGIAEITGWSGRLWSSQSPYLLTPYIIEVVCTIMAPGYLFIANFIIFVRIVKRLGPQFLHLTPKMYTIVFILCGTVALTIQAVGAGFASDGTDTTLGKHITLGGMALQLMLMTAYIAFAAEFVARYTLDRPAREKDVALPRGTLDKPIKQMLFAMFTIAILLYIRSIYRIVTLSEGYGSTIVSTEWIFAVFDGGLVALAMFTLNRFHPGVLLAGPDELVADVEKVHGQTLPLL